VCFAIDLHVCMFTAADQAERLLMVGYTRRTRGCWRAAKHALQEGAIGTVRHINAVCSYDFRMIWEAERLPTVLLKNAGVPESFFVEIPDSTVTAEFVRGVKGENASLASSREGAHAVALTEAAYRAAGKEQWIHIEISEI